uniref:Wax synthase domain-containing protein n=2 Tax=Oryza brachyantha TaxID=4533 RepID=J3LCI8_ORYBR
MLYARLVAAHLAPGIGRLLAFTPVLALLLVLPFAIPLYGARGTAAFFLVWLGEFKLLLLASGRGPLDPSVPTVAFVFSAALPVKLTQEPPSDDGVVAKRASLPIVSLAIKLAVMAVAIFYLLREKNEMNGYMACTFYAVVMYCFLDFLLPCVAAVAGALGMELEPQFDRPYLSSSLQDFWGRRWNLMASAVLRPAVYHPVKARLGAPAGVFGTFLVSGLMHEVIAYYISFRAPTGQVTAFFALHGFCVCAERWCARRCRRGPPRAVATVLVVGFVAVTAFSLFFPAIFGDGVDDIFLAEFGALGSSFVFCGQRLLGHDH